jgi:hypothetical protein
MGRLFVLPHKAAVAVYVGAEYSGELAFQSSPRCIIPFGLNDCQIARDGDLTAMASDQMTVRRAAGGWGENNWGPLTPIPST